MNNIRAVYRPQGLPRQILARASLNANTLDEAITILTGQPRSGAFHHTLGQLGDARLFSVEATGQGCSVLPLTTVTGHANHLLHAALAGVEQIVTDSSASRQLRLVQWRETQPPFDAAAAKTILSDTHDAELPIYRLPTIRMRRTPSPRQFSPSMPTTSGGKFSTLTATMLNFMEKCVGEIAGRQS